MMNLFQEWNVLQSSTIIDNNQITSKQNLNIHSLSVPLPTVNKKENERKQRENKGTHTSKRNTKENIGNSYLAQIDEMSL